jgi:hypothetical protein
MVAKAEGKAAAKAKKRVATRIIKASNESVREREWEGLQKQLARE